MKAKKLIITLALVLTMGLGVTAYASTESNNGAHKKAGMMRVTGMRGYDYVESVLRDKLGMTEQEITDGLNSGKTMYDLAKDKGMTEDQFKAALLEERTEAVDKAVTDGNITTEEAATIKETLKNNMDNCNGIPGQKSGRDRNGKGHGAMLGGGSRGTGNCSINSTVE